MLPWKITEEGDTVKDEMGGHIEDVKKHTMLSIEPIKSNTEEMSAVIKRLEDKISDMDNKFNLLLQKLDRWVNLNDYGNVKVKNYKIFNKLLQWDFC